MPSKHFMDLRSLGDALEATPKQSSPTRRVAVIGSGVAGLAAAKYLLAETTRHFEAVVFERHSKVGGIWNLTSPITDEFQTPMYQGLETNVPRTLMTYSDFLYPSDVSLFPTHDKIQQYLESYSRDIGHCIRLNSEVTNIVKVTKDYNRKWKVSFANAIKGCKVPDEYFHAVIVATGTFNKPYVPADIRLDEWEEEHPGSKVLIIGGGPSYFDIARRISPDVKGDIIVATDNPKLQLSSSNQRSVSKVQDLRPKERCAIFSRGEIERDIDIILLCTGYQYDYPFIPMLQLGEDGKQHSELWEQMFYIPDPSMAFVGIPKMGATFIVAEAQGAYIARALADRLYIPSRPGMKRGLEEELKDSSIRSKPGMKGELEEELKKRSPEDGTDEKSATGGKGLHNFGDPKDKEYINRLSQQSRTADGNRNLGKQPPSFDDYLVWTREILKEAGLRLAFFNKGDERHNFPSPESLGFHYDPNRTKAAESRGLKEKGKR